MKKEVNPLVAIIVLALVGVGIWAVYTFVFTGKTKGQDFLGIEKKKSAPATSSKPGG